MIARKDVRGGGCWLWSGQTSKGYGKVRVGGEHALTHRLVYRLFVGNIPKGRLILHRCDTPACCNPDHLFMGSPRMNSKDMVAKGRSLKGVRNSAAILTEADVIEIRRLSAEGVSRRALGRKYGVTRHTISLADRGLTWRHV